MITKIEEQKRNKDRVNIYIDDEFAFAISLELVYKYKLKVNTDIDSTLLKEIALKDSLIKCKNHAIKIIERTFKTEKELSKKLKERGYEDSVIKETIDFLKEYNYINDSNYAKAYVKDKSKTSGNKKILYSLKQKGVSDDVINSALDCIDENEQLDSALLIAEKKYNNLRKRETDEYKLSQKMYRFLLSRGYSYDIAKTVLNKISKTDY